MSQDKPERGSAGEERLPLGAADFRREVIQHSLMRYDVLRFFHQNPYAILTVSDLSVWVSREERPLAEALQQLAALGYLGQSAASAAFVLTSDRDRRRKLAAFFDYLQEHPDVARRIRDRMRRAVKGA